MAKNSISVEGETVTLIRERDLGVRNGIPTVSTEMIVKDNCPAGMSLDKMAAKAIALRECKVQEIRESLRALPRLHHSRKDEEPLTYERRQKKGRLPILDKFLAKLDRKRHQGERSQERQKKERQRQDLLSHTGRFGASAVAEAHQIDQDMQNCSACLMSGDEEPNCDNCGSGILGKLPRLEVSSQVVQGGLLENRLSDF